MLRFVGSNVNELYDLIREVRLNAEPLWEVPRRKAEGGGIRRSTRLIPTNLTAVDDVVHRHTIPRPVSSFHKGIASLFPQMHFLCSNLTDAGHMVTHL